MALPRKKNTAIFIFLILVAAASTGYYFYNKGPVNIQHANAEKIGAAEIYNSFIHDSANAQRNYSGKIISVSGNVAQTNTNQQGQTIVLLKTAAGFGFINCTLAEAGTTVLKEGQPVVIKGICSGLGETDADLGIQPDLYLERCIVQQ